MNNGCDMKEKEVKISLPKRKALELFKNLKESAIFKGKDSEKNLILDSKNRELGKKGMLLRLRKRQDGSFLTFKGPVERSQRNIKVREEIEVSVSSPSKLLYMLEKCGFIVVNEYSKQRWNFDLKKVSVQFDKVPGLGYFVEIENPDENKIESTIKTCGLGNFDRITESYSELVEMKKRS